MVNSNGNGNGNRPTGFLLVVRRRLCGCIVAAAVPGTPPARELERVFGTSSDYRVVPLIGRRRIVRCPHEGSPYHERNVMTERKVGAH